MAAHKCRGFRRSQKLTLSVHCLVNTNLAMASPAPKSPEVSDKSKKYDRQLRLWGDHGQAALENANICLVNATGVGTEILKSLVLPGIGAFTIVDGKKVREEDSEVNFFVEADSIGKPRAEVTTQFLVELNPDVHGDYVEEEIEHVLQNNPTFFNNFTVVIATALKEQTLIKLSATLWAQDVPFIYCKSYGFLGYIRLQVREHTVIELHPDNQTPDLRLDRPFPALLDHINQNDLSAMTLKDHAHVPYLIILYKALVQWQSMTGKLLPGNWSEKEKLRDVIRSGKLVNEHGVPEDEENFEEAVRAVNSSVAPSAVPPQVKAILDDLSCVNLTSKSKPFWIMANAMKDFVESEGQGALPLRGSLPDMTAETSRYIGLQQIYQTQAKQDTDAVYRRVQHLLHVLNQPPESVSEADVKIFCRHASELDLIRGSSIEDEYHGKNENLHNLVSELDPPGSLLLYYVLLRGVERFQSEYNCYPGELKDDVEPDIMRLKSCISKLLAEWGWAPLAKDDYIHELCRYGGCELHSVSAFVGGCAAQEAIKLITKQYKPLHNTFIYDGMTCTTATFCL